MGIDSFLDFADDSHVYETVLMDDDDDDDHTHFGGLLSDGPRY